MLVPSLRVLAAALSAFLLAPVAALAADGEATPLELESAQRAKETATGAGGGDLVRTIVGLAVVLAVIYGLHWVLKQVKRAKEEKSSGSGLESLASLPLGANRSLHLVRAGEEIVLVGVGEAGVTHIRTYREHEARALGLLEDGAPRAEVLGLPTPARERTPAGRLIDELRKRTVR